MLFELLGGVVHHVALLGLVAHGAAEFAGHQRLRHVLLSVLPEEQRHFLPLHQHCPHQELVERVGETASLWVIDIHNLLFASLLVLIRCVLQLRNKKSRTER